jgi:hypothetical protein
MTHEDAGHYAAKHPQGTAPNPAVAAEIEKKAVHNTLTCAAAHSIAVNLGEPPAEVGRCMDLKEVRLLRCQLGLFGYTPEKKIVSPADAVAPEVEQALTAAALDGRIACETVWQIAHRLGIKRLALSAACEALGLKVKPCQLGAF